jgi:hypothetical protein
MYFAIELEVRLHRDIGAALFTVTASELASIEVENFLDWSTDLYERLMSLDERVRFLHFGDHPCPGLVSVTNALFREWLSTVEALPVKNPVLEKQIAEIRWSFDIDKKSNPGEMPVRLVELEILAIQANRAGEVF